MANSNRYAKLLKNGLLDDNPILTQVIGICSTLAVTNLCMNSLVMGLALAFITGCSSFMISLFRKVTPEHIRMMVQVFIIAFLVIIVDIFLRAYMPEVSKTLRPYVGLTVTNCTIVGRAEAFAISSDPVSSFADDVASGLGCTVVLVLIALIRELLGFGSVFKFRIMPASFVPWTMMVTSPAAFFILPIVMWIANAHLKREGDAR